MDSRGEMETPTGDARGSLRDGGGTKYAVDKLDEGMGIYGGCGYFSQEGFNFVGSCAGKTCPQSTRGREFGGCSMAARFPQNRFRFGYPAIIVLKFETNSD